MGYKVLWLSKTGDANAWYHIYPFVAAENTEKIYIVRLRKPQRTIESEKAEFHTFKATNRFIEALNFLRTGHRILKSKEIDFIITFGFVPWGVWATLLSWKFKKPILVGLIGNDFNRHIKTGTYSPFLKRLLRRATIITTPGLRMSRELGQLLGQSKKIREFKHCLANDQILKYEDFDQRKTIVSVSDFNQSKRIGDIIRAIEILRDKGTSLQLLLFGEGKDKARLEKYVEEKGLGSNVKFLGYVKDIRPYLAEARGFVQASLMEGLSLSLIEAMGMGAIPVTTKAGAEEDIIQDGVNGLFIEKQRPEDIAEKLEYLQNDSHYARLQKGLQSTTGALSVKHFIEEVESFQDLLGKRK